MDAFLAFLQAHLAQHESIYAWIMIGDDPLMYALGKRRHETWAKALLPCAPDDRSIDFLVSKLDFLEQAANVGLPVPPFLVCSDVFALRAAADTLGYPLVVKEREGYGGKTVSIIEDSASLASLELNDAVIAQAFIPGTLGSASVYFDHGRLVGYFSYFRERTWGQKGASTAVVFHEFAELDAILGTLGRVSGFHGLCGIDFIQHAQTGQLVLLEQNFRPTLTALLGRRVGVNMSELIQKTLAGIAFDCPVKQSALTAASVPLFPMDVLRAIDERDLKGLIKWFVTPGWWPEMNWRDARLLRYNLKYILKFFATKLMRQFGVKLT